MEKPLPVLYTFSARITPLSFEDRLSPQVLSIFDDPKLFPECLIFREFSKGKKLHYHLFFKSTLKESAIRKRIKNIYSGNRMYSLHPIAIGDNIICTDPKHDKPNCLVGARTYCAKEGDVIYRQGISADHTKKFIKKGQEILSFNKQKLHQKIIQKYKINANSSSKTIVSAYLSYRQEQGHAGFPANKFVVQNILNDIVQAIDPRYVDDLRDQYSSYLDNVRGIEDSRYQYHHDPGLDDAPPKVIKRLQPCEIVGMPSHTSILEDLKII